MPGWDVKRRAALIAGVMFFLGVMNSAGADNTIHWENLHLSPEQNMQIEQLEAAWQQIHAQGQAQLDRHISELRALLPTGDTGKILQLQTRINHEKNYLLNQSMDIFLKKRAVLTPAQRLQLQRMIP